jgi:hypothetical protein
VSAPDSDTVAAVLAVFGRKNANGDRVYRDDDIAEVLPLCVLAALDGEPVPAALAPMLNGYLARAGVSGDLAPAAAQARLDAHLAAHPPNSALLAELQELVDGHERARHAERALEAARALGTVADLVPVGAARIDGAVRGGVFARLATLKSRP